VAAALYATIWASLLLLCVAETGRRRAAAGSPAPWAWPAFAAGAALCAIHVAIAMGVTHGWSHASAIAATARQTNAVYGLDWGGGVYANYVFAAVWCAEAWRWRAAGPRDRGARVWPVRIFFLVMILNAAVIFVSGPRRFAGAALLVWLLRVWRPARSRSVERSGRPARA
jgi:hypothetical protein